MTGKISILTIALCLATSVLTACNADKSNDSALVDYAESFNSQAEQLVPLTPAITDFNARVDGKTFIIEVAMDTMFIRPESLTEENVKSMIVNSLTSANSKDKGFADALEASDAVLKYRCTAGDRTLIELTMTPADFKEQN